MIYYINFFLLVILTLFTDILPIKQFRKCNKIIYVIMSLYLYLFAAFRINTGYDFDSYKSIFEGISKLSLNQLWHCHYMSAVETGYVILNYMFKFLSYQGFLAVVTAITMLPKYAYICFYTNRRMLGLLFYYTTIMLGSDMGIIRQSIAMGICLWAYKYFSEKNYRKFLAAILFASLFHSSVLIMLLLFVLKDKVYTKSFYYITIIIAFLVAFMQPLKLIVELLAVINNNYIVKKITYYAFHYSAVSDSATTIFKSVSKRLVLFVFFTYTLISDAKNKHKKEICLFYNAFFLSIVIALLAIDIPIVAGRGTMYFQITQMFMFAALIEKRHHTLQNGIVRRALTFVICCVLLFNNLIGTVNKSDYIPYQNIFFIQWHT